MQTRKEEIGFLNRMEDFNRNKKRHIKELDKQSYDYSFQPLLDGNKRHKNKSPRTPNSFIESTPNKNKKLLSKTLTPRLLKEETKNSSRKHKEELIANKSFTPNSRTMQKLMKKKKVVDEKKNGEKVEDSESGESKNKSSKDVFIYGGAKLRMNNATMQKEKENVILMKNINKGLGDVIFNIERKEHSHEISEDI